ncbi:hypothetical protein FBR07_04335 [Candidatus Uhrbacteria bacterium UHB]|jgi:hypothetical protein|uniref:Uncharacterized protein n=1 Tax=candidate division WWE3 bacterium TaxID=2053526 RepID=A0A928Y6I6_UNCKA|nr:hypothetical protein [candidate division WWE3 bacterium]MDL1953376.1 hypothetical protein [Candidatus Uhrbacteria bacterium UHB]RIL00744.1 MAG: hypothetical protein DCC77_04380 [Candidatus Uhrbacteria bacterium]
MKRCLFFLSVALGLLSVAGANAATLSPGDLIKASGSAVYYYGADGTRLAFPNEKTYFTWYADFSSVKTVTDAELAAIPYEGKVVTYRPGTRMLKLTTDPKVYAVGPKNELRWITNEQIAGELFGSGWAMQVDDLPDAFFVFYNIGSSIAQASEYSADALKNEAQNIGDLAPAPSPEPGPLPEPEPSPLSFNLTMTPSKAEAQPNEGVDLLAQTNYPGQIQTLDIFVNGNLYTSCASVTSCSISWKIPTISYAAEYVYTARLVTMNEGTFEATGKTAVVMEPLHASIQVNLERETIRPNQIAYVRSQVVQGLTAAKNEIVIDGVAVKACTSTPGDCRYQDYVAGEIGSTHQVYARVETPDGLKYRSAAKTLTIAENDTPIITLGTSLGSIYPSETVEVHAVANDDDGVDYVEILYEEQVMAHCIGALPCFVYIGPFKDKPSGTVLEFKARAADLLGAMGETTGGYVLLK